MRVRGVGIWAIVTDRLGARRVRVPDSRYDLPVERARAMDARRAGESVPQWIERVDPEVARAVQDVDATLLAHSLSLSPFERLRACSRAARGLARFHVAP